jgi:hypothetical protein
MSPALLRTSIQGNQKRMRQSALLLFALALSLAPSVFAQSNLQLRYQQQLDQIRRETAEMINPSVPAGERLQIDYGAYITLSYLSADDPYNNNHGLREADLVGYANINLDDVQDVYFRGRLTWQDYNPGDNFTGDGDYQFHAVVDRAYYRFDLQRAMSAYQGKDVDYDVAFQGGRQLIYWGTGLTLVQTLDSIDTHLSYKTFDMQLMGGVTPANTIDYDPTRPQYDSNTHRGFYGLMLSKQIGQQRPYLYFLTQQDYNHNYILKTGPIQTMFHYDSYYVGAGSAGTIGERLSYGLEGVFEGGKGLSNSFTTNGGLAQVPQTKDTIQAFAGDFRLDYVMSDSGKSHVGFEEIFATGDTDRRNTVNTFGGNTSGTKDTAFNAFGQVNNGLAFAPAISNITITRFGFSTFPLANASSFRAMQSGLDLFFYTKFSDYAPIDEVSLNKGYLGFEPDIYVNWQVRSDVTLSVRYGIFFPGVALPSHDARQFLYGGLTFGF